MNELTENQKHLFLEILSKSHCYETVRIKAVKVYNKSLISTITGISEKCTVFFNPRREQQMQIYSDEGIEKYFELETYDTNLPIEQAVLYKKSFVWSFIFLLKTNRLSL